MKTIVTIALISLVLIFRQSCTVLPIALKSNNHEFFEEVNLILATPGLGWIEDSDYSNLKVITSGMQINPEKEPSLCYAFVQEHFRFSFHYQPNPLLIDRPPPSTQA